MADAMDSMSKSMAEPEIELSDSLSYLTRRSLSEAAAAEEEEEEEAGPSLQGLSPVKDLGSLSLKGEDGEEGEETWW